MRAKVTAFAAVAILLVLGATPVYGQEVPPLPHAFYGTVEINDSPAPAGTQVEARGGGVRTGLEGNPISTTTAGAYGNPDPMGPKLVVQGDILDGATVTFYVNGVSTEQMAEWHSGEVTQLDLSVSIPTPPPPSPPPGGGGGGGGGGGPSDTTPPTVFDTSVANITETTADISWRTDEKSDSQVEYGSSPSNFSPLDPAMVSNHFVHLTDLTPATIYHYRVMSRDKVGNLEVSDEYTFTTLGKPPAAVFTASSLIISPSEVSVGEAVTISVSIINTGDAAGSYTVTLKINGVVEATKEVTLSAGTSQEVTFTAVKDVAGTYTVDVDGLSGSFTVKEKPAPSPPTPLPPAPTPLPPAPTPPPPAVNWPLIGGIIGGVAAGIAVFLVVRRRRA
jgi:hypothetical protein